MDYANDPTLDSYLPRIGANYTVSKVVTLKNGIYDVVWAPRPCILFPLSVSTVGTCRVYAGAQPPNDESAVPIPAGNPLILDGRGRWYIKTGSGASEKFLLVDAGQAGNIQAIVSALGIVSAITNIAQIGGTTQTGLDLSGKWAPRTFLAVANFSASNDNTAIKVAARVGRKALVLENTGTVDVWISFISTDAAVNKGIRLAPGRQTPFDALDGITEQAVYAISADGTAQNVAVIEAT